jgi:enoyl-CoA hydratase
LDLIVASEEAVFGLPEVSRAWSRAPAGCSSCLSASPTTLAMEIALTGAWVPARHLDAVGLINRLVPPVRRSHRRASWPP